MTRREFVNLAAAATGAAALRAPQARGAERSTDGLVDVNVDLGRWPLRRLPADEPERLVPKLRAQGVTQAWVGSFDGLLHKDLGAVNGRLAEDCRRYGRGLLLPFGSINPKMPGWRRDFHRCLEVHRMRGIRLHPNYHGYRLDEPEVGRLLALAAQHHLVVELALLMEDERMMHPRLRVAPVDPTPLAEWVKQITGLRLVLLNALAIVRGEPLRKLFSAGEVCVETATLEGVGGIENFLKQAPPERLLFGSHAPYFYLEAAALKLKESSLTLAQSQAIRRKNAERLLTV